MTAAVVTWRRVVTGLGALVVVATSTAGCGEDSDSGKEASPTTWSEIQEAACVGGDPATDHSAAVREQLSPEELEIFDDLEATGGQPSGAIDYLSCGGEAPFLRSFDSTTAAKIWVRDELVPSGCSGSAVADEAWVVYSIQDSAVASVLEELGGELLDC